MNTKTLARRYDTLTAEERFRLSLAAGARGDKAEQARIISADQRICLSMSDRTPWCEAFDELAFVVFIEMLDEVAKFDDARSRLDEAEFMNIREAEGEAEDPDEDEQDTGSEAEEEHGNDADDIDPEENGQTLEERRLDLLMAQGWMLKTRYDGWKLFCERLDIPPFAVWQYLPGYERLQSTRERAEKGAFVTGGMVRWLNSNRPDGCPEVTAADILSPERLAEQLDEMLRWSVKRRGG